MQPAAVINARKKKRKYQSGNPAKKLRTKCVRVGCLYLINLKEKSNESRKLNEMREKIHRL